MRWVVALLAAGMLGGCLLTPAQEAAQKAAADQAQCASFGFKEGTDQFANCRMNLAQARERRNAERADEFYRMNQAQQRAQAAPVPAPLFPAPLPPRQTTCQPVPYTNTVQCNTF